MVTQYYFPGQSTKEEGGGGYHIFILVALTLAVVGVALYQTRSDFNFKFHSFDKDTDHPKKA